MFYFIFQTSISHLRVCVNTADFMEIGNKKGNAEIRGRDSGQQTPTGYSESEVFMLGVLKQPNDGGFNHHTAEGGREEHVNNFCCLTGRIFIGADQLLSIS